LTREEYKKRVWEILKGYNDIVDEEDLEGLLDKIMAVPLPEKKKGKVTVNKKDKRRRY
jgi:hypothetical protein